jgi:hypothetical protein
MVMNGEMVVIAWDLQEDEGVLGAGHRPHLMTGARVHV